MAMTENRYPICFSGTRPTNIISMTTAAISAAVEKFSGNTSAMKGRATKPMYFMAFLSAPVGVCSELRICAVARTSVPFASSDGCSGIPSMLIHLAAPFADVPMM